MARKENAFMNIVKEVLHLGFQTISESVVPKIVEGVEMIMDAVENRIIHIWGRILKKLSVLFIIGFGLLFLIFALFFALKEFLGWGNAAAFFYIGITIFLIGLLLKLNEY